MHDDRFDHLMRRFNQSYRVPPDPPLDEMWRVIERSHFEPPSRLARADSIARAWPVLLAIAASLAIGIGIGRSWPVARTLPASQAALRSAPTAITSAGPADASVPESIYEIATSRYLGEAAALLTSLPFASPAGRAGAHLILRARDLLSTTRLLLDSPAARDPELRALLDDLELVLAQIARMADRRAGTELELIAHALEQRDVLPRLYTAVADNPSTED